MCVISGYMIHKNICIARHTFSACSTTFFLDIICAIEYKIFNQETEKIRVKLCFETSEHSVQTTDGNSKAISQPLQLTLA